MKTDPEKLQRIKCFISFTLNMKTSSLQPQTTADTVIKTDNLMWFTGSYSDDVCLSNTDFQTGAIWFVVPEIRAEWRSRRSHSEKLQTETGQNSKTDSTFTKIKVSL